MGVRGSSDNSNLCHSTNTLHVIVVPSYSLAPHTAMGVRGSSDSSNLCHSTNTLHMIVVPSY
ncbi:hypothetical protein J6590_078145, partial [Homalodisca vitripennis]